MNRIVHPGVLGGRLALGFWLHDNRMDQRWRCCHGQESLTMRLHGLGSNGHHKRLSLKRLPELSNELYSLL